MINIEDFLRKIEYKNIILAVSGGIDSVVMLDLFLKSLKEFDLNIELCHINHSTRDGESDKDEIFVKSLADKNDLILHSKKVDMYKYSEENSISPEESGRILRKKFFEEILETKEDKYLVALAHNRDDQVETVLMRIIRGTGVEGLIGMNQIDGYIIRPLLNISKKEIIEYQQYNNLEYVQDKTNLENIYNRNKIRNELLPLLRKEYNFNIDEAILKLSEIARSERIYIGKTLYNDIENIVKYKNDEKTIFNRKVLSQQDEFTISEILRMEIDRISSNYNFTKKHYEEIIKIVNGKSGAIKTLNSIVFYNSFDNFVIRKEIKNEIKEELLLKPNKEILVNGYTIYNKSNHNIKVRTRYNGDKFIIKDKHYKLKRFLIDNKIDLYDRDIIPIIELEDNIIVIGDILNNSKDKIIVTKIKEK